MAKTIVAQIAELEHMPVENIRHFTLLASNFSGYKKPGEITLLSRY